MQILDIAGRRVKVSHSTISVLNENGKTASMITGVETFHTLPAREQFELAGMLRQQLRRRLLRLLYLINNL